MDALRARRLENIKSEALRETREQSYAITRQLLGNHRLECENGQPAIAGIEEESDEHAAVYFPVEGESYFFVVYLNTRPEISVRFAGMGSGSRVYCKIVSETLDLADLRQLVPLEPNRTWQKGERVSERTQALRTFSAMSIEPDGRLYIETEEKLERLLDALEEHQACFPVQGDDRSAYVQIAYYGYKEQMSGIHLSAQAMGRLSKLGLELDIDLYAAGPDLLE